MPGENGVVYFRVSKATIPEIGVPAKQVFLS